MKKAIKTSITPVLINERKKELSINNSFFSLKINIYLRF